LASVKVATAGEPTAVPSWAEIGWPVTERVPTANARGAPPASASTTETRTVAETAPRADVTRRENTLLLHPYAAMADSSLSLTLER